MEETWKPIINYEGLYKISNYGRGKSLYFGKERILRLAKDYHGYLYICLHKNNKGTTFRIHKLVSGAFIGPCPKGMECCHNDGDKTNNVIGNLRYDTRTNNQRDRKLHGTAPNNQGIKNPNVKLNEKQVSIIKWLLKDGYLTPKEIAKIFNVHRETIYHIKNDIIWR